jgi:uncharacterized membrane protein YphA (DoxX/SURF4 family)
MLHTGGSRLLAARGAGASTHWQRATDHPATALAALALRLYLASIWLRFGLAKIDAGWLTSNPLRPLVQLVADGATHPWLAVYEPLARSVLDSGVDRLLAAAFPLTELAIAGALATGILLRPAAMLATVINFNLVLAGLSAWRFDGRIIALQLLLLALGAAATRYGLPALRRRARGPSSRVPALRPTVFATPRWASRHRRAA